MIWAVILAAGESRRMGTQKLLLPFGDTTVVGAVVRTAAASRAERTLVVLGADEEMIRRELEPPGRIDIPEATCLAHKTIEFTVNDDYPLGMLTSIQAGFRALPDGAGAAVILLGDQPFLSPRVVDAVIAARESGGRGIVIPTFQGRRGHPVLIDLAHREEVLALDPSEGLRALMRARAEDVLEIEVPEAGILRDLDTPDDYADIGGHDTMSPFRQPAKPAVTK